MRCKLLMVAVVVATFTVAGQVANAPPAQARAIEVSASTEHRMRYRRNLWMSPWHENAAYLPP
jgi:hypothetical protein